MIIVNLKGGLGNQMFQYATGRSISIKNKTQFKLDISGYSNEKYLKPETPREYELKDFNIEENIASKEEVRKLKYPFGIISKACRFFNKKVLKKYFSDFHPEILKKKNYYLDGFWQSEKNFLEIRKALLNDFKLRKTLDDSVIKTNSLSIHIRRGDYVTNSSANNYHGSLSINYYKEAFDFICKNKKIENVYIFSDDTNWVKENFSFIDLPIIYISDLNYRPSEEIILMSKCDHNIIANSSFSWWGAWLNQNPDKIVVAPSKWLKNGDGPHKNIIPESWIRI